MNGNQDNEQVYEGDDYTTTNSSVSSSSNNGQDEEFFDYMGTQAILTYSVGFCMFVTILWLRFAKFPDATTTQRPTPRRRYHPDNGDEESIRSFRTILDYLKVREWRSSTSAQSDTDSLSSSNHSATQEKKKRRTRRGGNQYLDHDGNDGSLEDHGIDNDPNRSRGVTLTSFFQNQSPLSSASNRPYLFRRTNNQHANNKKEDDVVPDDIPDTAIVFTPETVQPEGVLTPSDVKQQATMDIEVPSSSGKEYDDEDEQDEDVKRAPLHANSRSSNNNDDEESGICCAICLETFHDHEKVCQSKNNLDCPHAFHLSCMTEVRKRRTRIVDSCCLLVEWGEPPHNDSHKVFTTIF